MDPELAKARIGEQILKARKAISLTFVKDFSRVSPAVFEQIDKVMISITIQSAWMTNNVTKIQPAHITQFTLDVAELTHLCEQIHKIPKVSE